ncbi:GGDEF domain-containing protein [Aureimonas ureilytica]|uniref:GGDEF domain-containing protein n=1 Tax=Aureimonas ureilytica TaxID=401562 RepID=UPI00058AD0DF|nr:GGDEF domain-containing protein [Aureimonas ureilytica]
MRHGLTVMDPSISTLQLTDSIVFATCGAVFTTCWLLRRSKTSFLLFGASFLLCAVMAIGFVDFGYYGSEWALLGWSMAGSLFWSGFRRFDGRSAMTRRMVGLLVLPTAVHLLLSALNVDADVTNAASTLAYALHEAAIAHYVLTSRGPRSPIRLMAGIALVVVAVSICFPLLPVHPTYPSMLVVGIFVSDHVTSIVLTTCILALDAEKAYAAIERLARTDSLTQLLNREGLASALANQSRESCVLFADLDHFKAVNDRFGHAAGDEVLKEFAKRATAVLPDGGHLARLGGEEFVLVFPGHDRQVALSLAERLRSAMASRPVPWNDDLIQVTVSVGVALAGAKLGLRSAIERADAALYEAKLAGRDCVKAA